MDFCQEIFNKIVLGILKQNCKYEHPQMINWTSVKSPLQFIIPKSDYYPLMEEKTRLSMQYLIDAGYNAKEKNLIYEIKWIHDNVSVKKWKKQFKLLAERFGIQKV